MSTPSPTLLTSYDAALGALLEEVERAGDGDRVLLSVYLIEPGASALAVLAALDRAAARGARVEVSLDATWSSWLSRRVERTDTLRPEVLALARRHPARVVATARRDYDHTKLALFLPAARPAVALFGGVNLGDRFRAWRDLMVRVEGAAAAALPARLAGAPGPTWAEVRETRPPLAWVLNLPRAGLFELRPAFLDLARDPAVARLRVAMAYLDRAGASILAAALDRGAAVDLLLPRRANVYRHANLRALTRLLRHPQAPARLRARLHPDMVHAKALLARAPDGRATAFLGSANLKRNSFRLFGELNAFVCAPAFTDALAVELDRLWTEAAPVERPPRYSRLRAAVEERLG